MVETQKHVRVCSTAYGLYLVGTMQRNRNE